MSVALSDNFASGLSDNAMKPLIRPTKASTPSPT